MSDFVTEYCKEDCQQKIIYFIYKLVFGLIIKSAHD